MNKLNRAIIQSIREGAAYRTVIAHRIGVKDRCVLHALENLQQSGLVALRHDANNRQKFELPLEFKNTLET
jgi:predicted transcriptional regulator